MAPRNATKSPKEAALDRKILQMLDGKARATAEIMLEDPEVKCLQDYSNTVSIKRLGFNDHGPVHMRKVLLNAIAMCDLLAKAGVPLTLEREGVATPDDSRAAIAAAALVHDVGMSVGRERREFVGALLALGILDRVLGRVYGDDLERRLVVRSTAIEGIVGHMGTQKIHSLEAGLILVADGLDMEKGRARIPLMINTESRVGDIHKHSAAAIERVRIARGAEKPIKITVEMSSSVGIFQIEEVLFVKIDASPAKPYLELYAAIEGAEVKRYL